MGNKVEHLGKIYELVFSTRNQVEKNQKELVKKQVGDFNYQLQPYTGFIPNKEVKP